MLFTVELGGLDIRYRLQKSGSWRLLLDDLRLMADDFTTTDPMNVDGLTPKKTMLKLDGTIYKVNPTEWSLMDAVLGSASMCFRTEFPKTPPIDHLMEVIAAGDDSYMNILVLNVEGTFELRQCPPFDISRNDPSIVVRHETFVAGNGYVGPEATQLKQLIDDFYDSSLEAWIEHLRTGETQEFSDLPSQKSRYTIFDELESIRRNWRAQY
jgi:hypothetical protein